MKLFLLALSIFLCTAVPAQSLNRSNTYVRTCLNNIECASLNSSSLLFFDESRGRFYMRLDFNELKTGTDSIDFWLEDLTDTYLYFVASLSREQLPNLSNYSNQTVEINGQLFLNHVWKPLTLDINFFRTESDMLNNSVNAGKIDAYRLNYTFSFLPKDFGINKKPRRLSNVIFIGVGAGQLNLLRAGQESYLGEAYEKQ